MAGSDMPMRGESCIWRSRDALCDATGKIIWYLGGPGTADAVLLVR